VLKKKIPTVHLEIIYLQPEVFKYTVHAETKRHAYKIRASGFQSATSEEGS
jgi:hypothetical protein